MGILDKVSALLPFGRERQERTPGRAEALALRDDLDRWLARLVEDPWNPAASGALRWTPTVDVQETADDLVVTAEVPGMDGDDLALSITPDGLTIRGEKREERDGEVRYASFLRTVPLPPGLDVDRAEARVSRGILTVKFPKVDTRPGSRRIPVRT
jgi:HSP20 family protein